jgi:DsbC/DsbD-like thiol-disulfide interchange protein
VAAATAAGMVPTGALAALLACSFLAPAPASAAVSPWASNPQSAVRLVSAYQAAPRHGEIRLGIQFRLAPRWHVYWKNSGDAGYAPVVAFARQPGLSYPELLWPAPHRFELAGGLEAFGYADEVVYPVRARLDTAADHLRITADVDYLVCEVDCVPHRYALTLDQPLADRAAPDPETALRLERAWNEVPAAAAERPGVAISGVIAAQPAAAAARKAGGTVDGGEAKGAGGAELTLSLRLQGVTAGSRGADLFFAVHPELELGRPRLRPEADGLVFTVPVSRKDSSAPFPASAVLAWTATGLHREGAAFALTGQIQLPITTPSQSTIAGTPGRSAGGSSIAGTPRKSPASGPREALASGDPRLVALLAAAAALLALELWGLLGRTAGGEPRTAPAAREALGFLALVAALGLLYALSLEVSPEGLASTELALLAMGLLAWLRRTRRSAPARTLLALALAACAVAPFWLAGRSGLIYSRSSPELHRAAAPQAPAPPHS